MYASVKKEACDDMVLNDHVDTSFIMQGKDMRRHGLGIPCRHKFYDALEDHATTWHLKTMSTQVDA